MKLLVSCLSTQHSMLKQHWSHTRAQRTASAKQQVDCPLTVLGSVQKPEGDLGGLLCLLDDLGCTQHTLPLSMAAGMAPTEQGLFVTTGNRIVEVSPQLDAVRPNALSLPLFNALHSLSRTQRGYLVASTGLDLLVEVDREGNILWEWWATEHGFAHTPTGERRQLDKTLDYRSVRYGTLQHTTHVNAAAALPDGRVLASLFHQGMVIAIDRESGKWQPLLEGLDHPHAVRVLDERHMTVADTVRGRALLLRLDASGTRAEVMEQVDAQTNWLQDCRYEQERDVWLLVDGQHSCLSLRRGRSGERSLARFDFDPEWRLYEACFL